jgi:uncharacterized protein
MKRFLVITILCLLIKTGFSQNFPAKPNTLVNDYTNTLSAAEVSALERKLVAFDDSTSIQISVVFIASLDGYEVADYGYQLGRSWGIGGSNKNTGILILSSIGDRKITIQTGYGMEGALPDAIAKRIIENEVKPNYKNGNYYQGVEDATNAIISYTKGEYKSDGKKKINSKGNSFPVGLIFIIIIVIISIIGRGGKGGGGRNVIGGRGAANIFWWSLLAGMGNSGRGSGGFGGGGGSGGGGFGGFGGGSFGGGGASGSW